MVVSEHEQYQRDGKWFHPHRDSRHIGFQCQIEMYICLQRKRIEINFICETSFRSCVCKLMQHKHFITSKCVQTLKSDRCVIKMFYFTTLDNNRLDS